MLARVRHMMKHLLYSCKTVLDQEEGDTFDGEDDNTNHQGSSKSVGRLIVRLGDRFCCLIVGEDGAVGRHGA